MVAMGTGQDSVCTATNVDIEGKQAAWVFSEFQSERSVKQLTAWLEPEDWPRWGGQMFKSVQLLKRTEVRTPDGEQWHGKILEDVSIGGQQLQTVLQCDVKKTARWAAMSYDLDHSVGDVLQVDRGFLAAIDLGTNKRLVKALKIVGFTDTVDDALATAVCPVWTEWILDATETAAKDAGGSPVGTTHGAIGDGESDDSGAGEAAAGFTRGYAQQWTDCMSSMADFYGDYATDVGNRLWSGEYGTKDAAEDSSRLFLRLARDWSRVWRASSVVAEGLADAEVPPTGGVPSGGGIWKRSIEYTTVLVPAPERASTVSVSDLRLIGTSKAVIKAKALRVDPGTIPGRGTKKSAPSLVGVRVSTDSTSAAPGLYEGDLAVRTNGGEESRSPVLFYVSKSRPLDRKV